MLLIVDQLSAEREEDNISMCECMTLEKAGPVAMKGTL